MKNLSHLSHALTQVQPPDHPHIVVNVATLNQQYSSRKSQRHAQSRAVRTLLANSMNMHLPPDEFQSYYMTKSDQGRPSLISKLYSTPHISLSHSHDWVACAWSRNARIGVDIEVLRDRFADRVSALFLHSSERAWLNRLPNQARSIETLRLWCLKEALFKASTVQSNWQFNEIAFSSQHVLVAAPASLQPMSDWHFHSETCMNTNVIIAIAWQRSSL